MFIKKRWIHIIDVYHKVTADNKGAHSVHEAQLQSLSIMLCVYIYGKMGKIHHKKNQIAFSLRNNLKFNHLWIIFIAYFS